MAPTWAAVAKSVAAEKSPPKPPPKKQGTMVLMSMSASSRSSTENASTDWNGDNTSGISTKPSSFDWAAEDDDPVYEHTERQRMERLDRQFKESLVKFKALKTAAEENAHLAESLKGQIAEKDHTIQDLQNQVKMKDERIATLIDEALQHDLHLKELVAQTDEKDRHHNQLERDLDEKSLLVLRLQDELDTKIKEGIAQSSTENDKSRDDDAAREQETCSVISSAADQSSIRTPSPVPSPSATGIQATASPTSSETCVPGPSAQLQVSESPQIKDAESRVTASAPAVRDVEYPVFATNETIKKTPPVPPAPKLTMGIDMSKYGQKKKTSAFKNSPRTKLTAKPDSKRTVDPSIVPTINPEADVRKMNREQREPFGNGGEITLMMGSNNMGTVPKYMLMQCSRKAYDFFKNSPDVKIFSFPADSMDPEAMKAHILWMNEMCHANRVFSITLQSDPKNDDKHLKICQAARVLGLNNTYVGHFTKQFCNRIRAGSEKPDFTLLDLIATLAYPENDPIFDCLANNMANQDMHESSINSEKLHMFLAKHPQLRKKVGQIEDKMITQRKVSRGPSPKPGPAK